jgi:hypothetical protein
LVNITLSLQRDARMNDAVMRHIDAWADAYEAAQHAPNGLEAIGLVLRYVSAILGDVLYPEFRDRLVEILPATKEHVMNEELSWAEMREWEGEQKGLKKGQQKVIERLLTRKFGALDVEHQQNLRTATPTQLEQYADRLLTAQTLDEVFAEAEAT